MRRRDFLQSATGATIAASIGWRGRSAFGEETIAACCRTYATPADAMQSPVEAIALVSASS